MNQQDSDRAEFEAWRDSMKPYGFNAFDVWQAAIAHVQQQRGEVVAWRWSESNGERWFGWTTDWGHHDKAQRFGCLIEYAYTAPQPAEPDPTLPYEQALSGLIDKIVPGLDSGDILADAKTASAALKSAQPAEPVKPFWQETDEGLVSRVEPVKREPSDEIVRNASGETWMGMRVAAWQWVDETAIGAVTRHATHWSTGPKDAERLYRESDIRALLSRYQGVQPRPTNDELWDKTLRDRDHYHDMADKLAEAIAKHFGADVGEHSNINCPWTEALEVISNAAQPAASAEPIYQVFHSNGSWEDVDAESYANNEDAGRETRTVYAAPVAAQPSVPGAQQSGGG